jgi:hypothetical protein
MSRAARLMAIVFIGEFLAGRPSRVPHTRGNATLWARFLKRQEPPHNGGVPSADANTKGDRDA